MPLVVEVEIAGFRVQSEITSELMGIDAGKARSDRAEQIIGRQPAL